MESTDRSDRTPTKMQVIMVPLPAQGHLNQLLHLSRTLAQRGLSIVYLATSAHIHQVRHRVQGWDPHRFDIRFEEVPMPDLPPEEIDTENPHKFPAHLVSLFEASQAVLQPHLDRLLRDSSHNRAVVMHDEVFGWVQTVALRNGVPAYTFRSVGAYTYLWMHGLWTGTPLSEVRISLERCFSQKYLAYAAEQYPLLESSRGDILNTFSEMETQYLSKVRERLILGDRPLWTVGPLLPQAFFEHEQALRDADSECLRWLDRQRPSSVLYVSFGSVSTLSSWEIRELAEGLERSGQSFLWVLRISDGVHLSTRSDGIGEFLPEGFERRTEGRGLVVRDWAPQLQVLRHVSTAAFVTHCGWNSTLESISAGVAMVAWPFHSDQFANSDLIWRELKVGVEVKEWTDAKESERVSAEEVERAVRRVMESEEGEEMRRRAQLLRDGARKAVEKGGTSWKNVDSLIHHFSQQFCT